MNMTLTLAMILELLTRMVESSNKEVSEHAKTLSGPRTRGSTTEHGLETLPAGLVLTKSNHASITPGCTGYHAKASSLKGQVGAISLLAAFEDKYSVGVRTGAHGEELYISGGMKPIPNMVPTDDIYVILGPANEYPDFPEGIIYTWHPGEPLLPIIVDGKIRICANTAVKLV